MSAALLEVVPTIHGLEFQPDSSFAAAPAATVANVANPGNPPAEAEHLLAQARDRAAHDGLPFAGGLSPQQAWSVVRSGGAVLVDVRTSEERKFVGQVPDALHVAWMTGTAMNRNPRFVKELENAVGKVNPAGKNSVILLLCRSGKRSAAAAEAATKAGFTQVFNVLEGFEGDLDQRQQRGRDNGWRFHDLPWIQD